MIKQRLRKVIKKKWIYFLIGAIVLAFFFYFQNNSIVTTEYSISSGKIPRNFNDYTIVQLSDLHSKYFGTNQVHLVEKVTNIKPDLIVFTGDLVDANRYNEKTSIALMEELIRIAPVYYVTGNHEWSSGKFDSLEAKLEELGIQIMRNRAEEIVKGNDKIQLIGIDDPKVKEHSTERATTEESIMHSIEGLEDDNYRILLSHRPEMLSLYAEYEFDIVFSGHAHGGQVRIPFIGGLVAPNQGLFPDYTSGKYNSDNTTMIVNRGLGNSIIPLRIFNRPEIIIVTLSSTS